MAEVVQFVMLLTLTEDGARRLDEAVDSLEGTDAIAEGLHGLITMKTTTCGRYDAVLVGHLPGVQSIASLVSWILGRGYFSSETLIGVDALAFKADGKGYTHS